MDKDQILAQMGVTQWRLREPIDSSIQNNTLPQTVEQTEQLISPATDSLQEKVPTEIPTVEKLFNIKAVTVTANEDSVVADKTWVFVSENSRLIPLQEEKLFNNILKAIKFTPLASVQHDDRSTWLQGLQTTRVSLIVAMGEQAARMSFPEKAVLTPYKLLPQQILQTITPLLILPSLAELLQQPIKKRDVWAALQEAVNLSQ